MLDLVEGKDDTSPQNRGLSVITWLGRRIPTHLSVDGYKPVPEQQG
jgi:hypothetical protein